MIVVIGTGGSEWEHLGPVPREIIPRVSNCGAYDSLGADGKEGVKMHSFTQDHHWDSQGKYVAKDELNGVSILRTKTDSLSVGVMNFVYMLIEEPSVK